MNSLDWIKTKGVPKQFIEQYKQAFLYLAKMEEHAKAGKGLLIRGGVGTTKTTLSVILLQEWMRLGGSGYFLSMANLLEFLDEKKKSDFSEWKRTSRLIQNCGMLVIDDLGAEGTLASWQRQKVDGIINDRYNNQKPIIVTTNLSDLELHEHYSERVVDRLKEMVGEIVITMNGKSLR